MRPIKFRGKMKDNGKWAYGSFVTGGIFGGPKEDCYIFFDGHFIEVIPETVSMWSGQVYQNKKLFEGDIVEIEYHEWVLGREGINPFNEDKAKLVIRLVCRFGVDSSFHNNRIDDGSNACYSVQFSGSAVKRKEIIGNIWDNPELLNQPTGGALNMNIDPKEQQAEEVKATETEVEQTPAPVGEAMESAEEEG